MSKLIKFCYVFGAASIIAAMAGWSAPLQAQHGGNCWQCTWYVQWPNQGYFTCVFNGSIGWNSCTVIAGGCVTGGQCGYYRPLADGTFDKAKPDSSGVPLKAVVSGRSSSARITLASRSVERGCNGTIVRRTYGAVAVQGLKRATSTIRV